MTGGIRGEDGAARREGTRAGGLKGGEASHDQEGGEVCIRDPAGTASGSHCSRPVPCSVFLFFFYMRKR